jgi:mono/diheme cytochrome c family protein
MTQSTRFYRRTAVACAVGLALLIGYAMYPGASGRLEASHRDWLHGWRDGQGAPCACEQGWSDQGFEGEWYWLRSPDQEKRVAAGLFNRYCIRCHAADGRGNWDIPGIPDFSNPRWQEMRSDAQRARIILEGRGAVMPPFRGALSLEEAWALGRYLHTFEPGTEVSRPDLRQMMPPPSPEAQLPAPKKAEPPAK